MCLRADVCVCVSGVGGHYKIDASGDRDLNLSVVYTTGSNYQVRPLVFVTCLNFPSSICALC